jgi:hypothetical protein
MTKLETLLIPIFLLVLVGALTLESADADTVRRAAIGFGLLLVVFLGGGFVVRYARHRKMTQVLRDAETERRAAESEPPPGGAA